MKLHPLFTQGQWQRLIRESFSVRDGVSAENLAAVIMALAIVGRQIEAEGLLRRAENSDSPSPLADDELCACYFYLAISWTRQSEYKKAKRLFVKNWRRRGSLSPEGRFFALQGAAFFAYFRGDFSRAQNHAHTALGAALDSNFLYGQALATDLWAHALVKSGQIQEGFTKLEEAIELFRTLRNSSVQSACESSRFLYRAEYGYDKDTVIESLSQKIGDSQLEDTYTKVNLSLELARQLTLRGRWPEADACLLELSKILYRYRNRRQEIIFHLRRAELEYQKGSPSHAWNSLRTVELSLHAEADRDFRRKFLGLSMKVYHSLQQSELADNCQAELLALDSGQSSRRNQNILQRLGVIPTSAFRTDDIIGGYLDEIAKNPLEAFYRVLVKEGFLGFLYLIKDFRRDQPLLIYLSKTQQVLLARSDQGVYLTSPLTNLQVRVLLALQQGEQSKQALIEKVWGYPYEPLRHDSLIYAAITGLRKALNSHAKWLENSDQGYRILSETQMYIADAFGLRELIFPASSLAPQTQPDSVSEAAATQRPQWSKSLHDLNARQIALFSYFESETFVNVSEYQKIFKVSEITACRDLSTLFKKGLLMRLGRARATRYCLPKSIPARFLTKSP